MSVYSEIMEQVAANIRKAGIKTVRFGEPVSAPNHETAYVWYGGETEKTATFTNVMVTELVRVRVYWKRPESAQVRSAQESRLWEMTREIQRTLRADSDIGGDSQDLQIELAETGWVPISGSLYRVLTIDMHVVLLTAETISA